MKKSVLILVFTASIFSNNLFSQKNYIPGFIVNNNNDTIQGLINYQNWEKNPKTIEFKYTTNSEVIRHSPSDIKAFYVADNIYISKIATIDKSPFRTENLITIKEIKNYEVTDTVFLELLVKGEAELYSLVDENEKKHYFIKCRDFEGELIYQKVLSGNTNNKIKSIEKYKGQLSYIFKDLPDIISLIEKVKYKNQSLTKITEQYNHFTTKGNTYIKPKEKIKLEPGVIAGMSSTTLSFSSDKYFDYLTESDFGYSSKPAIGLSLNVSLPKNRRKWSFYNELLYMQFNNSAISSFPSNVIYTTDYEVNLDISYLKISNLIRYSIPHSANFRPFINMGIVNGLEQKLNNSRSYETYFYLNNEKQITTSESGTYVLEDYRKYTQGLAAGLGGKTNNLSFEVRYEMTNGFSDYVALLTKTNSLYFLLGYWF